MESYSQNDNRGLQLVLPTSPSHSSEEDSFLPHHERPRGISDRESLELFRADGYDETTVKQEDLEPALTEDIYSLFYTANLGGPGFLFSILIYLLQFWFATVLFLDLFDVGQDPHTTNGERNRLHLPAGVDFTVSVAQIIGLLFTVIIMVQDGDICAGLAQLVEGYEKDIMLNSPNATHLRWLLTAGMRITIGTVFIVLSFVIVMQAFEVMSLLLNLTGVLVLQKADTIAYHFAAAGVLGKGIRHDTRHIGNLKQLVPEEMKRRVMCTKRLFSLLLSIGLLVPYIVMSARQKNGQLLCQNLFIQVDDSYNPQYAYYSGAFGLHDSKFSDRIGNRRPVYVDPSQELQLGWCRAEGAWTFSNRSDDHCNYIFKSSASTSFDVLDIAGSPWYVKTRSTPNGIPNESLKIVCNDCSKTSERCNGACVDNTCIQNQESCLSLSADTTTTSSLSALGEVSLFKDFQFMPLSDVIPGSNAAIYDHLVYVDMNQNAFVIFSGRRWVIFGTSLGGTPTLTSEDLAAFLKENDSSIFSLSTLKNISSNPSFKDYLPLFFSSPVEYGADSYTVDPRAVSWSKAKKDPNEPILGYRADDNNPLDEKLLCRTCDSVTSPCQNGGICNDSKFCSCPVFYQGYKCEYALGCAETNGFCFFGGSCNALTNICDCEPGFHGNLCQFRYDKVDDVFVCLPEYGLCRHDNVGALSCGCTCLNGTKHDLCTTFASEVTTSVVLGQTTLSKAKGGST